MIARGFTNTHLFVLNNSNDHRIKKQIYDIKKMYSEKDVVDIDEAKIVISIKNDQIHNLKAALKTIQKKTSIRLTDLNRKLQQQKTKSLESNKKATKQKEQIQNSLLQAKLNEEKMRQNNDILAEQITKIKADFKAKEKQYQKIMNEKQVKMQTEINKYIQLQVQLANLKKFVNIPQILKTTKKLSLKDLPSYLSLHNQTKQKQQTIVELSNKLQIFQQQIRNSMQQVLKKTNSYEDMVQILSQKNQALQENITAKDELIRETYVKSESQEYLLLSYQQQVKQQLDHLNQEIAHLNGIITNHQDQGEQLLAANQQCAYLSQRIAQMQAQLTIAKKEYEKQIVQATKQISELKQCIETLKRQHQQLNFKYLQQKEDLKERTLSLQQNLAQKDRTIQQLNLLIQQLNSLISQLEQQQLSHKQQLLKLTQQIHQICKTKSKLQQQQIQYQEQISTLKQLLHNHHKKRRNSQSVAVSQHCSSFIEQPKRSLLEQIRSQKSRVEAVIPNTGQRLLLHLQSESQRSFGVQQPQVNWPESYYQLLQAHNNFATKIFHRLKQLESNMMDQK